MTAGDRDEPDKLRKMKICQGMKHTKDVHGFFCGAEGYVVKEVLGVAEDTFCGENKRVNAAHSRTILCLP